MKTTFILSHGLITQVPVYRTFRTQFFFLTVKYMYTCLITAFSVLLILLLSKTQTFDIEVLHYVYVNPPGCTVFLGAVVSNIEFSIKMNLTNEKCWNDEVL